MASEKKVVKATTIENGQVNNAPVINGLVLQRDVMRNKQGETYTRQDGTPCYLYFVPCSIAGREFKATVSARDVDGYGLLDVLFDSGRPVVLTREIVTSDMGGVKQSRIVYHAIGETPEGDKLDYLMKGNQASDNSLLEVLFTRLRNASAA